MESRGATVMTTDPRTCLAEPSSHVQPEPGGGASLPRLLLIKPGDTGNKTDRSLLAYGSKVYGRLTPKTTLLPGPLSPKLTVGSI